MKRSSLIRKHVVPSLALGFVVLSSGCRPPEDAGGGHSHSHGAQGHDHGDAHVDHAPDEEHEEPRFQITSWVGGFEFFIEHEPAEVGEAAEYVTHVSELKSGGPRTEGPLTLRLVAPGGEGSEATATEPARPGIYILKLKTPSVGALGLEAEFPHDGRPVKLKIGVVSGFANHDAAHHAADGLAEPEGFAVLKERQWALPIKTVDVSRRSMTERLVVPGEVHAAAGHRALAVAPVGGRLLPASEAGLPVVGRKVERGDTLALVQPLFSDVAARLADARAAVKQADIELENARRSFERIRGLAEKEAKSQRELQEAERKLRLAETAQEAAREIERARVSATAGVLRGDFDAAPTFALISPIDGVVANHSDKAEGELVAEGEALYTVLNRDTVYLHGMVPENRELDPEAVTDVDCVTRAKDEARFKVLSDGRGRLLSLGGQVDSETRAWSIHIETPNPDGRLRIGQRVTLEIAAGEVRRAVAVPRSSLIEEDGGLSVYVQTSGEMFEKRIVRTGNRDGGWVEIISGVEEGERVVTAGAYAVRLSSLGGGAIPHGHHH